MIDNIFETKRGIYQLDTDTGLFTGKDQQSTPKRFLGSIDPQFEIYVASNIKLPIDRVPPNFRESLLLTNLLKGESGGFSPDFRVGYRPFGITCSPRDIVTVGEGIIEFSSDFNRRVGEHDPKIKIELGSKIDRVYRQLRNEERGYRVVPQK